MGEFKGGPISAISVASTLCYLAVVFDRQGSIGNYLKGGHWSRRSAVLGFHRTPGVPQVNSPPLMGRQLPVDSDSSNLGWVG